MVIEEMGQYCGFYYVFGGVILFIEGIGFVELNIDLFVSWVQVDEVKEVIMVISFIIEGDIIIFYIIK